ncbi:MAG: hypothetical protein D6796_16135 [Caldilineae bacterium]|nr:MAG: hypothetical protein D6796_16135 [Caldilineae bacterium]
MTHDVIELHHILSQIEQSIAALRRLGEGGGFRVPLVTTPDDFVAMIGEPIGNWRPRSDDLLWFSACKIIVQARQLLEQAARIARQMEDEDLSRRAHTAAEALDAHFPPAEMAFCVYGRLLGRPFSPER